MNKRLPVLLIILMIIAIILVSCVKQYRPISNETPTTYNHSLGDKYPNPFSPTTKIAYSIPDTVHVLIVMYNVEGQIVDTVENQLRSPGTYTVEPDCDLWESGIYFYKITAGKFTQTKKMVLLK